MELMETFAILNKVYIKNKTLMKPNLNEQSD